MKLTINPAKSFRRFRSKWRYDAPLLWFVFDLAVGFAKIAAPFVLIAVVWQHGSRLSDLSLPTLGDISENLIKKNARPGTEIMAVAKAENTQHQITPAPSQSQTTEPASVRPDNETDRPEMIPAVAVATQSAVAQSDVEQKNALPQVAENVLVTNNDSKPVIQPEPEPEPDQHQNNVTDISTIVNQEWVLEQGSDDFTIQFRTSTDAELLRQFAPVIASENPISIFPFKKTNDGRLVFGIATGLYESMEEALAAIETMTPAAQKFGPWVRPLDELQREINDTVTVQE